MVRLAPVNAFAVTAPLVAEATCPIWSARTP